MHEPCWQLTCYSQRQQEIVVTPEFFQAVPLGEEGIRTRQSLTLLILRHIIKME